MSFVVRVIKDAVENLSNSAFENCSTLVKIPLRRSCASPAATRAEKKPTAIANNTLASAISSIQPPIRQI